MVFRRVPLTTVRCSSNPTVVLHLLAPSQPESQLRSTKPEPIVTCGCTGKLPGMKYSSVSLSLGEAFRKMSWRFSMHPGHPLVSPGCPSTVLHPVVCIELLSRVLKSFRVPFPKSFSRACYSPVPPKGGINTATRKLVIKVVSSQKLICQMKTSS